MTVRRGKRAGAGGRVGVAKEVVRKIRFLGEREEKMRPVTCGSHPHPIYLHFIISLISLTSHTSSPPFHLLIKVLQLLWARGKTERDRERERGVCKENMIDLRRNNVLDSYIFIYPYTYHGGKLLLSTINF